MCYRLNDCQPPTRSRRLTTPLLDRLLACATTTTTADRTTTARALTTYSLSFHPVASSFCSPRFCRLIPAASNLISSRLASHGFRLASLERRISLCSATRDATDSPVSPTSSTASQPETHIAYHHPSIHPSLPQPATELHCWRRPLLSPTLNLCATAALSRTSRTPLPARRYISSHKTQRLRVPLSPLTRPPTTHHLAVAQSQSQHRPHCHCHLPHLITHLPSTPFILRSRGAPVPRLPPKA